MDKMASTKIDINH